MAKSRTTTTYKKKNSIAKLKIVVEKIQRRLSLGRSRSLESNDSTCVPEDVKEGHFSVIAVDGNVPKRFVVALSYLTHPTFLKLLEQAAEEYGFDHEGALTIPCQPSELEKMLHDQQWQEDGDKDSSGAGTGNWCSCKAMVQSY